MKKILYVVILVALFMACVKLKKGEVVEKRYREKYIQVIINTGSVSVPQYHPEEWAIVVRGSMDTKGRYVEQEVIVSKRVHDSVTIGMKVNVDSLQN